MISSRSRSSSSRSRSAAAAVVIVVVVVVVDDGTTATCYDDEKRKAPLMQMSSAFSSITEWCCQVSHVRLAESSVYMQNLEPEALSQTRDCIVEGLGP